MRSNKIWLVLLLTLAFLMIAGPVFAQQDDGSSNTREVDEFEQQIYDELAAINTAALPFFQLATQSMDSKQYETAQSFFLTVLDLASEFPPALRRLSYVEVKLGNSAMALSYAQRALELEDSGYNRTALAAALISTGEPVNVAAAVGLAKQAVVELPDSGYGNIVLLDAAIKAMDLDAIRMASNNLIKISPEIALPHYFVGIAAAENGEWEKAESELLMAQELGMPAEEVQKMLADLDVTNQVQKVRQQRWLRWGAYGLAGLAALVAIFLVIRNLVYRRRPA